MAVRPSADALLDELDPEQRAVATAPTGPVCVLAGAGTGKTRAITYRIAHGVLSGAFQGPQVLAVTFTTRAAGEMRDRLRRLGADPVQVRTFHSAALRQLQYFWPIAVGGPPPRVLDRKFALVAEAVSHCRLRASRAELRDLAAEIEWAKVTQMPPEEYPAAAAAAARQPPFDPVEVTRVYAYYDEVKRRRGYVDFEDVLLVLVGILAERPDVAETVRRQYRHFVVDEYQDVSPLQQRLLDLWLGERDSLCVVGDASQTIYSFAGATPEFLLGFRRRYPEASVVRLVRDYRSTPQVVGLASRLLGRAVDPTARHRVELVAQRPDGPEPQFVEYPDEPAEARGVAGQIRELLDGGVAASEVAVLFRTNAQSEVYEQALAEVGVPYLLRGAERFFERPEVREAMLLLRGAARGGTGGSDGLVGDVRGVLSANGWTSEPPVGSGATRERWESLAAVVRLAEEAATVWPDARLDQFVADLEERAAIQHAPTVQGVTLASLHAAKGLEWEAVFIVGVNEGVVPITYAQSRDQVEEERRLLYVGVTRARHRVFVSWALARTPGGRAGRRPSRFLDGLRPGAEATRRTASAPAGSGGQKASRRAGPARCRVCGHPLGDAAERKLGRHEGCPHDLDAELYERLRTWRLDRAREQGVPAYCVFTDATLTAIAEARPSSVAELSTIPGVGQTKLDRYGSDLLALCTGNPAAVP